jgi:UDP-glucose 4-epimerase
VGAGIGERHEPETHLIPLVLRAALDPSGPVRVFGADYATADLENIVATAWEWEKSRNCPAPDEEWGTEK